MWLTNFGQAAVTKPEAMNFRLKRQPECHSLSLWLLHEQLRGWQLEAHTRVASHD